MSDITQVTNNSNNQVVNYGTSKFAIGNNEFEQGEYTSTDAIVITEGTVFGRIAATGKLAILSYDAADGSKYPVGAMYNGISGSLSVGAATTVTITLVTKGKIDSSKLSFASDTTISSLVDNQQLKDLLAGRGLILETCTQLAAVDNQ